MASCCLDDEGKSDKQDSLSLYELVRSDLTKCSYCEKVFSYPCVLPCLHSFCGQCIDKLHKPTDVTESQHTASSSSSSSEQKENPSQSEDKPSTCSQHVDSDTVTVCCPLCKLSHPVPIGGFPANHFLLNLAEIYDLQTDDERVCVYCQYERIETQATARCMQCEDDLCESCSAAHKKTKLTRNHILAPFDQIKLGKYDSDIRSKQRMHCDLHTTLKCDAYCATCSVLVCGECQGHDTHNTLGTSDLIVKLSSAGDGSDGQHLQCLITSIKDRLPFYEGYNKFLADYQKRLEEYISGMSETINKRADLLHSLVDKHKADMLADIDSRVSKTSADVGEELEDMKKMSLSFDSNLAFAQSLLNYAKAEETLSLQDVIQQRLETVSQVTDHTLCEESKFSLSSQTSDEDCSQSILSLMGEVRVSRRAPDLDPEVMSSLTTGEKPILLGRGSYTPSRELFIPELLKEPQLISEFDSSLPEDSNNTWPTGVCTSSIGDIIICDRDNASLKIFSTTGKHKYSISGELQYKLEKPFDVAYLVSTEEIVVSDYGTESVKIFSNSGVGRLIISGEFEYPRGVAVTKDQLILVLDSELGRVTVHSSTDGRLLKTLKGDGLCSSMIDPYYLCLSVYGDILVTDFAEPNIKTLTPDNKSVEMKGEYGVISPQGLLQPYGLCQDTYGITLIADNRNDKISVMLPSGHFEKSLITHKDGLWQPIALCINMLGHLIITEGLGKVKIFKYV